MIDVALLIVITAVVAASIVDFVTGPLPLRWHLNQWIVLRWLLAGLRTWSPKSEGVRARFWASIWPAPAVERLRKELFTDLAQLFHLPPGRTDWEDRDKTLEDHLVRLATGGKATALYRLEGDQLAAQVNAAAEAVLNKPQRHAPLLVALAAITHDELSEKDSKNHLTDLMTAESTVTSDTQKDILAARHEVTLRIQRRLDDLQITTRSYQQVMHFVLCLAAGIGAAAVLRLAVLDAGIEAGLPLGQLLPATKQAWMIFGGLGGCVAPLLNRVRRTASA